MFQGYVRTPRKGKEGNRYGFIYEPISYILYRFDDTKLSIDDWYKITCIQNHINDFYYMKLKFYQCYGLQRGLDIVNALVQVVQHQSK